MYVSAADKVREAIKGLGYNSRQVSVRKDNGTSVEVRIKDVTVDFEAVDRAAHQFEKVDRCEYSGEILCGGNTFVFVQYDYKVEQAVRDSEDFKNFLALVKEKVEGLEEGRGIEVLPGYEAIFKSFNQGWHFRLNGEHRNYYGIADIALAIYLDKAQKKLN